MCPGPIVVKSPQPAGPNLAWMHALRPSRFGSIAFPLKRWKASSSISALQAAFRDPSSPFHIPPGDTGPESPDSPQTQANGSTGRPVDNVLNALEEAHEILADAGFDRASFWEQRIAWGDQDAFQHVNNVRYGEGVNILPKILLFADNFKPVFSNLQGRIQWMMALGNELGGPARAEAMIKGQGVSLILKSIEVQFRRPVTYPDTLLIGYRPYAPASPPRNDPAALHMTASAYSVAQRAFVAHSNEVSVWYDYDKLKKCDPGEAIREAVSKRMRKEH